MKTRNAECRLAAATRRALDVYRQLSRQLFSTKSENCQRKMINIGFQSTIAALIQFVAVIFWFCGFDAFGAAVVEHER